MVILVWFIYQLPKNFLQINNNNQITKISKKLYTKQYTNNINYTKNQIELLLRSEPDCQTLIIEIA